MSPEKFLSSSVWVARVKTFFQAMDVDRDGFLSLSDYEHTADRLVELGGDPSRSQEIQELFRALFKNMMAGGAPVDGNTKISEEECVANAAKAVTLVESAREVARRKNEVFFDIIDTDNSGEISSEEYRKYLAIYFGEEDSDRADQAFNSIDVDGNGSISRDEFIEGHIHYWFEDGSDPSFFPLPYGPLVAQ